MRYWLIGCGLFVVICIILVIFGGHYIYKQLEQMTEELDEVKVQYIKLDDKYRFEKPDKSILSSEQVERFAACRETLKSNLENLTGLFEDEETSGFSKFSMSFDIPAEMGGIHIAALDETCMSPTEYYWISSQFLLILRYAEHPKALQGLKQLRKAFDSAFSSEGENPSPAMENEQFSQFSVSKESIGSSLLPRIDPEQILLSEESIQAILENKARLENTMSLFRFFDTAFSEFFPKIKLPPDGVHHKTHPSDDAGKDRQQK